MPGEGARTCNAKLLLPWNCRPRAMYLCRDLEDTCDSYL